MFSRLENSRRERRKKLVKDVRKIFNNVFWITYLIITIIFTGIIASFTGVASKAVIYYFNAPLGQGYALYASYAITGLVGWLIGVEFIKWKGK